MLIVFFSGFWNTDLIFLTGFGVGKAAFKHNLFCFTTEILSGSKSVMTESTSETSREISSLKKRDTIQKKREVEIPKSSFVTTPKRTHTISLRETLLQASDKRIPNSENNHCPTHRRGKLDRTHLPTRQTGELDRASRPTRPFGDLDQLACLRPLLVAPSFGIGSNLFLFHLDRSHCWNFTI